MRLRKQLITNIYLKPKDIKALANGYRVYKRANKHAHALIPKANIDAAKAKAVAKRVAYHKSQLEKLIGKPMLSEAFDEKIVSVLPKRKYTKRNAEFWSKGGNLKDVIAKQRESHVQKGTL